MWLILEKKENALAVNYEKGYPCEAPPVPGQHMLKDKYNVSYLSCHGKSFPLASPDGADEGVVAPLTRLPLIVVVVSRLTLQFKVLHFGAEGSHALLT